MATVTPVFSTLSLYLSRRFLFGFFVVLLSIGSIIFLIDVVELMRRSGTRPDVTFQIVLQLAVLKLPYMLQKVLPFTVLFGSMHALWRMTRTSELIIARASGVSVWQFLAPAFCVAALIGAFFVAVINPVGSSMLLRYEQLEAKLFQGRASLLSVSEAGLWLRQSDAQGRAVIHAQRMAPGEIILSKVTIYLYDTKNRFTGRLDAPRAQLEEGHWLLSNVLVTAPGQPSSREPVYKIPTDWTAAKIQDSFSSPETLSFWNFPGFIAILDQAGFTAARHKVYWYSLLALPIMLAAMVLVAASFSLRTARRGGVATLIGVGVLFSFFLFFLSDVAFTLGLSSAIPAFLAAFTPAMVTLLIGLSILMHLEES
ncbi:MAG: LPS export ABC transporter permease LptG [Alphaproteobacteria bacterium]|jgi:lipopolysaccharide export system permease protein